MTDFALSDVADRLRPADSRRSQWHDDPAGFARDAVHWPTGEGLAGYQAAVLDAVASHRRVAVRSPRGAGKTTTAALLVLWHALTRDDAGIGWKCATTAASFRQLERYLWPKSIFGRAGSAGTCRDGPLSIPGPSSPATF